MEKHVHVRKKVWGRKHASKNREILSPPPFQQ